MTVILSVMFMGTGPLGLQTESSQHWPHFLIFTENYTLLCFSQQPGEVKVKNMSVFVVLRSAARSLAQ